MATAIGLVAAGAVAYNAAETDDGAAGDAATATGEAVVAVTKKVQEIEHEHHICDKTKTAAHGAVEAAKECDKKHHVVERTKHAAMTGWQAVIAFEKKHKLVHKTMKGIESGAKFVTKKITECNTRDTTTK